MLQKTPTFNCSVVREVIAAVMMNRRFVLALSTAMLATQARAHDVLVPDAATDHTEQLQSALLRGGHVALGAGVFDVTALRLAGPITVTGIQGKTIIKSRMQKVVDVVGHDVVIEGITFTTNNAKSDLVVATNCENITIRNCKLTGGARGLSLQGCSGRVAGTLASRQAVTAIFSNDAKGLIIAENFVTDCANNGIQVWRSEKGEDGTQVVNNQIARIRTEGGGNGQNGNGVNVYRAGNVIVSGNRITDCAYSAIRDNSGDNVQILGNSISRCGEVAIFVEFAYHGAVVSNNIIEDTSDGISITNYDNDGRLAVCSGNVIRKVKGGPDFTITRGIGITAEADLVIEGNIVEDVHAIGIQLGWGRFGRNLVARDNLLRDCDVGIAVSVVEGVGLMDISGNVIDGAKSAAIQGFDHEKPVTEDWGKGQVKPPKHVVLGTNTVR
jgi:uncharacterized secreted repeat protein (TIGR03808 family)